MALAIFVFLLAAGGEYTNNLLKAKNTVVKDIQEPGDKDVPDGSSLSFNIFNSVIQVSNLVFHSDLIFEFNLPEICETKAQTIFNPPIHYSSYYLTLFRSIISPNAP